VSDPASELRAFVPTGDGDADVVRLRQITDLLTTRESVHDSLPELLGVFERHPEADLGSPGPLVHKAEEADLAVLVGELIASLNRRPTAMTVWMARRCLNGRITPTQRQSLAAVLRAVLKHPSAPGEVRRQAEEVLVALVL
jgi:hypothetical protein